MIIGGFQKNSLIDFPGTIACVIFSQGCNLTCPYCHNPGLVAGAPGGGGAGHFFDEQEIFQFLEQRKGMLDGVVITGGEPTLQKDIVSFCAKIKQEGFQLKMDTNGTRPDVLKHLLDQSLLDYVAMDVKTTLSGYDRLWPKNAYPDNILESIRLIMEESTAYEFRTTCIKPFVTDQIMIGIGEMIQGAKQYYLQKCSKNVGVLEPNFIETEARFFTDPEMAHLKKIMEPLVDKVSIR